MLPLNGPSSPFLTFLRALCQMDRLNKVNRFGKRSMWRTMSGIYPFVANVDWMNCRSKQVLIGCGTIIEGHLQTELYSAPSLHIICRVHKTHN